ncbi:MULTISPECIES: helix-turn-helix transcriptional regulator [Nocardia]|uniref:helix-turn-helix transcriptional regulator n=1 Tax=Nocardia TaxID=1817 RepID=UPI000BF018C1|nr:MULTISPECIES: YafY family protein [Nocardia]MBF6185549.1 YafY family transcriptional regulator [Nocardia farcinica]MBF6311394.1 YafY family transcriptional regulator [Nocardia farcinica]MBF6408016.1 YafY family transcriptional regulator [Nocardia farcinica]PEH76849.1 transcriptional regulator [Nocardia sp. FDAARGOS_372]UEX21336.1 YafY family transcriptional regulator [Nocardia farcinica]
MSVEATTERVLRLLALLQRRPSWTAAELAAELRVTDRSVRRDVERLRALGYPVQATAGVGGGYRLGAGTRLPPLLFDDEEAIATAVSLRMASGGTVAGTGEAALRALAKLDQVMPPRLRTEVRAVHGATDTLVGPGAEVDADVLVRLAHSCRDAVRVRFRYAGRGAADTERTVEPVRMVATSHRWYLMAWDIDRADWRTFRLDRMRDLVTTTWRFRPREHPDPVDYVQRSMTEAPYPHLARIRLHAPARRIRELVPPQVGRIEDDGDGRCLLIVGGMDLDWLAVHVARLGVDADVLEPPELRAAAARLARRLARMGG